MKGALFENLIINEFIKRDFHRDERRYPYFWQDSRSKEIDCLLVDGETMLPIEIKSGKTISDSYLTNLKYWLKLAKIPEDQGYVVYGGDRSLQTNMGSFISWQQLDHIS